MWPIVMMGVAGLLVGGVYSMAKAKKYVAAGIVGAMALLALVAAYMWWP